MITLCHDYDFCQNDTQNPRKNTPTKGKFPITVGNRLLFAQKIRIFQKVSPDTLPA
tara:strand:- start:2481 stop:2648 length:168 start_codon:yes stop_codon:yes gene_type:complete